jgi:glucose/arabinose dehydrogenase
MRRSILRGRRIVLAVSVLWAFVGTLPPARVGAESHHALILLAAGLNAPNSVVAAPDGAGRLFVTELTGRIRIVENQIVRPVPFLDISRKVKTATVGQGLYDIAFHPNYAENGNFYVSYVALNGDAVLARYHVSSTDPNAADPNSEKIVLAVRHPHDFHYGGQIEFGPDRFLYYSMGDGGSGGDKEGNAQNKASLLGSIMRLDVDHGDPYTIPPGNPFAGDPAARPELWAKGLRNPWRFSFDQATGDLYIADVGQDNYEEIDFAPAHDPGGENYGWNQYEGNHQYRRGTRQNLTFPVFEYDHGGGNCSITGGYVYRGDGLPDLGGKYLFGDYCSGMIWALEQRDRQWSARPVLKTRLNIASFGQAANGDIMVVDSVGGSIFLLGNID